MAADRIVMSADDVRRALTRISHEIVERNDGAADMVILGIPTGGVPLAARIAQGVGEIEGYDIPYGSLDVTMHRDDLRLNPTRPLTDTDVPVDIDGKLVVLVDDVLYSGRTVRAALDALSDLGRPRAVQFAALVDRGHRELPIRADFVGKNLPTARSETVKVSLQEFHGSDQVTLVGGGA